MISAGHFLWDTYCAIRDTSHEGAVFIFHGAFAFFLYAIVSVSNAWQLWALG